MAKYNNSRFQLGAYYLGQRKDSPAYYRMWVEGRRTRMVSLKTTDFDAAKKALTTWFVAENTPKQVVAQGVPLGEVLTRYYEKHGKLTRSKSQAKVAVEYWQDFWADASVQDVANVEKQEAFQRWLAGKDLSPAAVQRVIVVGKAAINRSYKRGEILSAPKVLSVSVGEQEAKGRALELGEIKSLYAEAAPHAQTFIRWALATAARPEAVLQLHESQIDREKGVIFLNPVGRTQNKKYRPTVKLPPCLAGQAVEGFLVQHNGEPVKSVKTAWKAAVRRAGLDDRVQPYSLRKTCAMYMMREGVPALEVSLQLGHKRLGTTGVYVEYSPDYLGNAVKAIDKLLRNCGVGT